MFHHDDFFNYIVDCILQQELLHNNDITKLHNLDNKSSNITSFIEYTDTIRFINLFYKDIQSDIDAVIKYEYPHHIDEY
jgi:hypothetical protein